MMQSSPRAEREGKGGWWGKRSGVVNGVRSDQEVQGMRALFPNDRNCTRLPLKGKNESQPWVLRLDVLTFRRFLHDFCQRSNKEGGTMLIPSPKNQPTIKPNFPAKRVGLARHLLALACLLTLPAQAHSVVNAGNVQLDWHTDTNEVLQVAGDTTLTLNLQVAGKAIEAAQCRCTLLLYQGPVSPRSRPVVLSLKPSPSGFQTVIAVKQVGSYSLVLDGKPVKLDDFAPFRVTFQLVAAQDIYNLPKK